MTVRVTVKKGGARVERESGVLCVGERRRGGGVCGGGGACWCWLVLVGGSSNSLLMRSEILKNLC